MLQWLTARFAGIRTQICYFLSNDNNQMRLLSHISSYLTKCNRYPPVPLIFLCWTFLKHTLEHYPCDKNKFKRALWNWLGILLYWSFETMFLISNQMINVIGFIKTTKWPFHERKKNCHDLDSILIVHALCHYNLPVEHFSEKPKLDQRIHTFARYILAILNQNNNKETVWFVHVWLSNSALWCVSK